MESEGPRTPPAPNDGVTLGLGANWQQFWLLVLVNAFVGAMVGLERTVLPLLAEVEFGLSSKGVALSFIVTFGLVKAATNFFAGRLGDLFGRRHILILGWIVGAPVPFLLMWAPAWSWIVFANVLLGINQGLAWSTTVIMKIDLVGPHRRGFAMGLNEFAGYLAVALSALATGYIAESFGLRPEPFYLGIAFVAAGLSLSLLFVRETKGHAELEARSLADAAAREGNGAREPTRSLSTREIVAITSWKDPALFSASQAGLINNLNDGLAWGLLPLFFVAGGLSVAQIGVLAFTYPAVWGLLQIWTGALSDRLGRRGLIAGGMAVQGIALIGMVLFQSFGGWAASAALLGVGTAMVYPTLLAAIGDVAHPNWRGSAVGVYRLWRDSGYAVGALLAGFLADRFDMPTAIITVAILTLCSGGVVVWRMPRTLSVYSGP